MVDFDGLEGTVRMSRVSLFGTRHSLATSEKLQVPNSPLPRWKQREYFFCYDFAGGVCDLCKRSGENDRVPPGAKVLDVEIPASCTNFDCSNRSTTFENYPNHGKGIKSKLIYIWKW